MRFKRTGLLHCSTDTNHSCMDNWRKLQTSQWRLSAESIEIIVQTALILYQFPSLCSSKGLVTPYTEGHYIGQSFLHLAKMQVGRRICHFDKTTPTKVDIEVLLSKHLKGIFQWMYMVRARAHLQNTTNSLLHVRHYQLCLLSFNTSVSQYFLFYIFRLRQGTVWGYGPPKIRMMDLMLETCYTLCSFEALFSPTVSARVLDLSATTWKIWLVNKLKVVWNK